VFSRLVITDEFLQSAIVLQAVETTLKEQDAQFSPTGYFAALLSLLTQTSSPGQTNKELETPIVYLLDVVAPFTPQPILRAKFTQILALLAPLVIREDASAPLLRSCIGCLESLLLGQDSVAWDLSAAQIGPRRAVSGLLGLSLDHRPKVRKRALEALRKVLVSPPPGPSLDHPAAGMCAESAMTSLRDLAERTTKAKKERKDNQSYHDPSLMHGLQLVKVLASSSGGWPSKKIEPLCELLLDIARGGNDHLTVAVFEVFEMIFEGMADETASSKLPHLLEIISEMRPQRSDVQLLPSWVAILSRAYDIRSQIEPDDTFHDLPAIFDTVAQFLQSPFENIRISASECLISFLANCVPRRILLDVSIYDEKVLSKLAGTVTDLLTVPYHAAWAQTFGVIGAMFDVLRWRASPLLFDIVRTLGEMRSSPAFTGRKEADQVIGKAIRAMGPEAVLEILPLNLTQPSKDASGRAWLLPLLRDHVSNANLGHFRSILVPLSEYMFDRVLRHGSSEKTMEIKIYETVIHQIWSMLPGYCDLPLDLEQAFDQAFAELLANLLYQQVDLRLDICRALQTLVESNQAVASITEEDDDLILQSRVSQDAAKKNLEYIGSFAGNFLAVLFNVYGQTAMQSRTPILQTINAFVSVTPEPTLMETFDRVCNLLGDSLRKSSKQPGADKIPPGSDDEIPGTRHTLMDLVITMSVYLPRASFGVLFEIASLALFNDTDPQLQKKAYKLIPRLAQSSVGKAALVERHSELQDLLTNSAEKVSAPARRERLAAIAALIPLVPDSALHFIPSVLSEVVICCKEHNERARAAAFDLLVLMGGRMKSARGALIDNSKVPHLPSDAAPATASLEEFFTMVSAGLAGSTPHMISASITAITRILYEYHESLEPQVLADLVQTMDLFLTSNNREIVRSVLGFVKVCTISLPRKMVEERLSSLIPNLMVWSHEHKGHFRSKVKHIIDRMVRRFGFDTVYRHCPEPDRKLITHIRKTKERAKKQSAAAKEAGQEAGQGGRGAKKPVGQFESEFDQALYSSDESEVSSASEDDVPGVRGKRGKGAGGAYIVEDDDEPLDLLDRKTLASISSTKPTTVRRHARSKAKTDADGKLVIGVGAEDEDADDMMDVDPADAEETSGVGAYAAAVGDKDAPKRGLRGKLKWSNKRARGVEDDEPDDLIHRVSAPRQVAKEKRRDVRSHNGPSGSKASNRAGKGAIHSKRQAPGQEKRRGPFVSGKVGKLTAKRNR